MLLLEQTVRASRNRCRSEQANETHVTDQSILAASLKFIHPNRIVPPAICWLFCMCVARGMQWQDRAIIAPLHHHYRLKKGILMASRFQHFHSAITQPRDRESTHHHRHYPTRLLHLKNENSCQMVQSSFLTASAATTRTTDQLYSTRIEFVVDGHLNRRRRRRRQGPCHLVGTRN
jgi:hypothetical protein